MAFPVLERRVIILPSKRAESFPSKKLYTTLGPSRFSTGKHTQLRSHILIANGRKVPVEEPAGSSSEQGPKLISQSSSNAGAPRRCR
ncbi:excinuclease ABC subunit A [Anopheles sinensis]|uniref:Excinuclease ABC subunit A n=1 Tax=Anopheles sinensis TaxID=74873 RepID=A0A084WU18_ANOSI|nr:excinuclease ABC subunit A [Anopheles sinensis]